MVKDLLTPDYIFEASWEVCNKVGGIYTVLSTRANTLQTNFRDKLFFIGPDVWQGKENPLFIESDNLCAAWKEHALNKDNLSVRVGRWNIPGEPIVILVDFQPFFEKKNEIYTEMWNHFQVDSLHAYGDYDEASMFSFAAAKVVESFYTYNIEKNKHVVYHGNEWMTGLGLLYIKNKIPQIATVFTTHATSIGRSIAGNNKPLYEYLSAYNGDQMALELNMQSKHSIEKQTAMNVDCFTTVSDITAIECKELLDKPADVVLPNGFEDNFVPTGAMFTKSRKTARKRLLAVANALMGTDLGDDTLIVSTSGRYEFRNKGIDVYIESMNRLRYDAGFDKNVIAFIEVPGWTGSARKDLAERINEEVKHDTPLEMPFLTHWLNDIENDKITSMFRHLDIRNRKEDKVKFIFIPCYLNGKDGLLDMTYYDIISGNDLCVYPSYYEPWGYTPLESIAFKVPCITTNLAGFGLWANSEIGKYGEIEDGVKVISRTDYNYSDVADEIKETIKKFACFDSKQVKDARDKAYRLSKKALWDKFIKHYYNAYDIALKKVEGRNK